MSENKAGMYLSASIWYIVANFLGQGIVLISNIIFTRIMSQSDYGLYSTYYSVVALLTPFVGANLFVGLTNGYFDFKEDRKNFRGSIFFLSIVVFFFFSLLFLSVKTLVFPLFNFSIPTMICVFTLIHAYSFFIINYYNTYANLENNYRVKSLLIFLPNFLQVAFSIFLINLFADNSYFARVVGSTSGVLFCGLIPCIVMLLNTKTFINKKYFSYALKLSVPSVLSSIAYMVMQQSDHIMITAFVGAEYTAVYSLVYLIGNVMYAFLQATGGVFQSWLYRALDSKQTENVCFVQKWYLVFFLIIAIGLLMVSPEIIKILSPESYWDFRYIPPFVASSALVVMNSMYCNIADFNKKQHVVSLFVLLSAFFNVVTNLVFIKLFGSLAAAYTSFGAYVLLVILVRSLLNKMNRNYYSDRYFIMYLISVLFGCFVFLMIYHNVLIRYVVFSLFIVLCCFYCIIKKGEIFSILGYSK